MANLLSRKPPVEPFSAFDDQQRARFEERARLLFGLSGTERAREFDHLCEVFSAELEELDSVPSLEIAQDLLDRIDRRRRSVVEELESTVPNTGVREWICFWPGRSLATGEAEIASRGFFDVLDRPPLEFWLEAMGRRSRSRADTFELAILCWIPPAQVERARAGRRAVAAEALAFLDEVSDAVSTQANAVSYLGPCD